MRRDLDKHLYQKGINQQYYISAKGGGQANSWLLSVGHDRNVNELAADFNRTNIRLNNSFKVNEKIQILSDVYITKTKSASGRPRFNEITAIGNNLYPYAALADEQGNPLPITKIYRSAYVDTVGGGKLLNWRYVPLEDYKYAQRNLNLQDVVINAGLQYTPLKVLTTEIKYQYEKQFTDVKNLYEQESFYARDLIKPV